MSVTQIDGNLRPRGYQQLTSLAAAAGLTPPAGGAVALIQATGANVRWRDDGVDPTASVGMQLLAGKEIWYTGDLSAVRCIEETASAKLNVSYYQG